MSWIKCDSKVKAKCAFKIKCYGGYEGVYLAGSECDKFAQKVLSEPPTNADRIRAMSDEELAEYLVALVDDEFRGNVIYSKQEVDWIEWLKQPARTPLEGDVLLEDMAVFSSAQQAAERRGEEAFTCPLCGGTAWWGRSKTNGHLHCGCNDCRFKLME